jgi:hypothetical protein
VIEVPSQEVITKDNAMVTVDGVAFFQVLDAAQASYEVRNETKRCLAGQMDPNCMGFIVPHHRMALCSSVVLNTETLGDGSIGLMGAAMPGAPPKPNKPMVVYSGPFRVQLIRMYHHREIHFGAVLPQLDRIQFFAGGNPPAPGRIAPRARGAEDRVGERVGDGVGIGMPGEAAAMGNPHPAQHQRPARDEAMGVVPDADAGHAGLTPPVTPRSPSSPAGGGEVGSRRPG